MRASQPTSPGIPLLLALGGLVLLGGCETAQEEPAPIDGTVTEVSLEAPTASADYSVVVSGARDAELASLRAENSALTSELERIQADNRSWAMETARLREEVLARPAVASPPSERVISVSSPPPAPRASASSSASSGGGMATAGAYTVQAASYRQNAKGEKAASQLVKFFEQQGFAPTTYRPSGNYLIVLVGSYGSKSEAQSARDEIAQLAYHGRRGDFKSAAVRHP